MNLVVASLGELGHIIKCCKTVSKSHLLYKINFQYSPNPPPFGSLISRVDKKILPMTSTNSKQNRGLVDKLNRKLKLNKQTREDQGTYLYPHLYNQLIRLLQHYYTPLQFSKSRYEISFFFSFLHINTCFCLFACLFISLFNYLSFSIPLSLLILLWLM